MLKTSELISLFRPLNLMIIALTMYVTRYAIIFPFLELNSVSFQRSHPFFLMLVLSIILLTAYGYIVNDMADVKSDEINQKLKVDFRDESKLSKAQNVSFLLLVIGLFLGFSATYLTKNWMLLILIFFIAFSVWFYSKQLKRFVFLGNLIVAFLCGLVPLLVAIFDLTALADNYRESKLIYYVLGGSKIVGESFYIYLFNLCLIFGAFAFLLNLKREIVKDIEDSKGDALSGYNSIAVNFGKTVAYNVSMVIGVITLLLVLMLMLRMVIPVFEDVHLSIMIFSIFSFVMLPLIQSVFLDYYKKAKR